MTLEKYTIKAQSVIQEAVNIAQRNAQQSIEPIHLLKAIIEKAGDITNFVFQKLGVNAAHVVNLTDAELQHQPKVQGGDPYLSTSCNQILLKAEDIASISSGSSTNTVWNLLSSALSFSKYF